MSASAPFVGDARDVFSFGTDRDSPAWFFRGIVLGDGAPGVDTSDIGEHVDVLFALLRSDAEFVLDLGWEEVIRDAVRGDVEVGQHISLNLKAMDGLLVHLLVYRSNRDTTSDERFRDCECMRGSGAIKEASRITDNAGIEVARGFWGHLHALPIEAEVGDDFRGRCSL